MPVAPPCVADWDAEAPPPPLPLPADAEAVVLVGLDALVVRVDWVVDVLGPAVDEERLFEPPHAASSRASGSTVRNRVRGLTICRIDADHLA